MKPLLRDRSGQGLIETAIILPFLLVLAVNAINLGWFCYAYINFVTGARQGVEYSIQGLASNLGNDLQITVPPASAVSAIVYTNLQRTSLPNAGTSPMQICTLALGTNQSGLANCLQYNGYAPTAPMQDPESASNPQIHFVLNQVDITYTVNTLITGSGFNLLVKLPFTFRKTVYMRAMG